MNSEILCITRRLGFPSSFGVRSGLGDFLDQYPDGIYAESGIGAPIGWESAAVWFGGESERAAARFERMVAERNDVSRLFRTRVAGTLVITFLYRLKRRAVTAVPVGGAHKPLDPDVLNFYMPNGGTISLNKTGSPTVVELEYWLSDDNQWRLWEENSSGNRSLTLTAGQTMYVRNTSETQTGFSTSGNDFYRFGFTNTVEAHGNTNSLLCKNADNVTTLSTSCYRQMFYGCTSLVSAPELPATSLSASCYRQMFYDCTSLVSAPELPATSLSADCYRAMFQGCTSLQEIRTQMTDISATSCLTYWLYNVSPTGDLYCPAELTIPTGASGIPSGWTRHNYEDELYLNFTMPNGGDITLTKTGSPTNVTLEYLIEGTPNWVTWTETNNVRTLTLTAGQKVFIRNTSETSTGFSTGSSNYYQFAFTDNCYADGPTDSLLCKNYENAILSTDCYMRLFYNTDKLIKAPTLPSKTLAIRCYIQMFYKAIGLVYPPVMLAETLATDCCESMLEYAYSLSETPILYAKTLESNSYKWMFVDTSSLTKVVTHMTNISAGNCLFNWLKRTSASGDFYCDPNLTIPVGDSGIPTGWTRHDLSELS